MLRFFLCLIFFNQGDLLETISSCRDTRENGGQQKIEELVSDCFVIFIHAQQSGLYRIRLQGPNSKYVLLHYV